MLIDSYIWWRFDGIILAASWPLRLQPLAPSTSLPLICEMRMSSGSCAQSTHIQSARPASFIFSPPDQQMLETLSNRARKSKKKRRVAVEFHLQLRLEVLGIQGSSPLDLGSFGNPPLVFSCCVSSRKENHQYDESIISWKHTTPDNKFPSSIYHLPSCLLPGMTIQGLQRFGSLLHDRWIENNATGNGTLYGHQILTDGGIYMRRRHCLPKKIMSFSKEDVKDVLEPFGTWNSRPKVITGLLGSTHEHGSHP